MSIAAIVTSGYGNGVFQGSVPGVVTAGYLRPDYIVPSVFFTIRAEPIDRTIYADHHTRTTKGTC